MSALLDLVLDVKSNEGKYYTYDKETDRYNYNKGSIPTDKVLSLSVPELSLMMATLADTTLVSTQDLDRSIGTRLVDWAFNKGYMSSTMKSKISSLNCTLERYCAVLDLIPEEDDCNYNTVRVVLDAYITLDISTLIFAYYILEQKEREYAEIVLEAYMGNLAYYNFQNKPGIEGPYVFGWIDGINDNPETIIEEYICELLERQKSINLPFISDPDSEPTAEPDLSIVRPFGMA